METAVGGGGGGRGFSLLLDALSALPQSPSPTNLVEARPAVGAPVAARKNCAQQCRDKRNGELAGGAPGCADCRGDQGQHLRTHHHQNPQAQHVSTVVHHPQWLQQEQVPNEYKILELTRPGVGARLKCSCGGARRRPGWRQPPAVRGAEPAQEPVRAFSAGFHTAGRMRARKTATQAGLQPAIMPLRGTTSVGRP